MLPLDLLHFSLLAGPQKGFEIRRTTEEGEQDLASMVPYRVVFRVLGQEFGRQGKNVSSKLTRSDLKNPSAPFILSLTTRQGQLVPCC